ncbi:unnamed protein product [Owenia fusiformis]|uniref:Uncharacterized protein n=1 Tax=Owenia fusiformis TaxID=6347 RepID=A0A8J1XTT0_OWEFU|nr:unnamed protein product [Owenia fusiformis]
MAYSLAQYATYHRIETFASSKRMTTEATPKGALSPVEGTSKGALSPDEGTSKGALSPDEGRSKGASSPTKETSKRALSSEVAEISTGALSSGSINQDETSPGCCSQRLKLALVLMLGFACVQALHGHMGLTIICMVKPPNTTMTGMSNNSTSDVYICQKNQLQLPNQTAVNASFQGVVPEAEFEWDALTQGLVLSSIYSGGTIGRLTGGFLARIWGPKRVIGISLFIAGTLTMLTPFIARLGGAWAMIAMTFATGAATDMIRPVYLALWANWAPEFEKTKLVTISFQGTLLGGIVSILVTGILCETVGWSAIFYVFGGVTLVWVFVWVYAAYDSPSQHPRIHSSERMFIENSIGKDVRLEKIPWKDIITSKAVLALIFAGTTGAFSIVAVNTLGATFLTVIFQLTPIQIGLVSCGLAGCTVITAIIVSLLSDILRKKKILTTVATRKLFVAIATISVPIAIAYSHLDCRQVNVMLALLFISGAFSSFGIVSLSVNALDIAPQFASIIAGISDAVENAVGVAAPLLLRYITRDDTSLQWRQMFYINGGIVVSGIIVYLIFGKGHVLPWAKTDTKEKQPDESNTDDKPEEGINHQDDAQPIEDAISPTELKVEIENSKELVKDEPILIQKSIDAETDLTDATESTNDNTMPGDDLATEDKNNVERTDPENDSAPENKVHNEDTHGNDHNEKAPDVTMAKVVDSLLAIKA